MDGNDVESVGILPRFRDHLKRRTIDDFLFVETKACPQPVV